MIDDLADPKGTAPGAEKGGGYPYNNAAGRPGPYDSVGRAGYGESPIQRTFREYLLILRERIWYVVIVMLVIFLASLAYTLGATKLYTAMASIEILARDPVVMKVQEVRDTDLRGPEDLNTQVKILESASIVQKVADRLSAEDQKALVAPYEKGSNADPLVAEEVLAANRRVLPVRSTRILQVAYTHPDPDVAAKVANLFVEEFMNYSVRWRVDESMRAVEDLKVRAEEQAKKVQELGNSLQSYRERQNLVSLDQSKDIVTEKLKALNTILIEANSRLTEAEVRWNQVDDCLKAKGNLANLAFIASSPIIQHLQQDIDAQKVAIANLGQRYRELHPRMLEATEALAQAQAELGQALRDAAALVRTDYETALNDVAHAKADLANQEKEAMRLDRFSVDYGTLQNELNVNQELLANIVTRMRETSMSASIETHNARVVDPAVRPRMYSSPNVLLNLACGAAGGLFLGLSLAFLVALIDDRVKSAYQIESVIGLPLIGIIPKIRKAQLADRARIVTNESDPLAAEAFLTIHSNLRLKSEAREAKVILVTSTRPGEGKTFISSNLALAFAEHGERTILVDCDLRRPNVHRSFGIGNAKGVIHYCEGGASVDSLIVRRHAPNLDLLPSGGRASNPTQVLNGEGFARLIAELRTRYDRVFIDTPPLGPVSDAMIILPAVDGVVFALRFNHVRAKGAQFCARRLMDSKVPCFGAILNGLDLALGEYYYAEYYDKSYRAYTTGSDAA